MKRVTCFSVHNFELPYLKTYQQKFELELDIKEHSLDADTAQLVHNSKSISCFAHDDLGPDTLDVLKAQGVEMISLRSAGYSHLDVERAEKHNFTITRVPSYSPEAIAEHAIGLLMCLNRKYIKAAHRVRELNFTLNGLQGYTLYKKTVGVIGAGNIGKAFVKICLGLGCKVLIYDIHQDQELQSLQDCKFTDLKTLLSQSDVISLHCPLNPKTHHIINEQSLNQMKNHAILINTGRGGLINTQDLIKAIKMKKIGGVALDVYEFEENVFFKDLSQEGLDDDTLARLLTFPNVMITSHQAFFTYEALEQIAKISMENCYNFFSGKKIKQDNLLLPLK